MSRYHKKFYNAIERALDNADIDYDDVLEEIKEDIKRYTETNDNENTTIQNLWDTAKAALRGRFIATQSYPRKEEKTQIT